jgi:BirA family biotin operon repressor/biotin-[acetyl-CoA-carboxylase] ligase
MSLVLEPHPLPVSCQFLLGAAVATGCLNAVRKYVPEGWKIKWPNDLYWGDRKAAGILIENVIKGKDWLYAVIGVGMNLNQTSFSPDLPNPVSLKQITGTSFEPLVLALELAQQIRRNVEVLQKDPQTILATFNECLYKRGEMVKLKKGNMQFETRIESVNGQGQLLTAERGFDYGEVEFVLG